MTVGTRSPLLLNIVIVVLRFRAFCPLLPLATGMLGAMQKSRKGSTLHKPQKRGRRGLKKRCHWPVKFLKARTAPTHVAQKRTAAQGQRHASSKDLKRGAARRASRPRGVFLGPGKDPFLDRA